MPLPLPPRVRNSTGNAVAGHAMPTLVGALGDLRTALAGRGEAGEVALEVGEEDRAHPAAESCSAISWSVFVLPVPVAPATRPWRLSTLTGICTGASGWASSSMTTAPSLRVTPSKA